MDYAKSKGAHPILITPVTRRTFATDGSGNMKNSHITTEGGDYPQAVRNLGAATGTPVIDLTARSMAFFKSVGDTGSKAYFLYVLESEGFPGYTSDLNYPYLWHSGYGNLSQDRPNHFCFDGSWLTPWRHSVGLQLFVESGAPLNKMGYPFVFLVPRGSAGRLPTLWEGSLTLSYPIAIGPVIVTPQAYLFNLFNKQVAISRDENWSTYNQPENFPATKENR